MYVMNNIVCLDFKFDFILGSFFIRIMISFVFLEIFVNIDDVV